MTEQTALLSSVNFSAAYDRHQVLDDVSCTFNAGEFVCLLGPNGSGKSTFLTQLAGLEVPSLKALSGSCSLNGKNIKEYSVRERASRISFLPQNETYSWNYSVLEAVRMGCYARSTGLVSYSAEEDAAARKALLQAEIAHLENRFIFELSGGEMQSVLIARTLAQNTDILILDEPFTFLDAGKADRLMKLLRDICKKENKCLIMSLHDINNAPLYADRIMLFSEGRLIADGKCSETFTAENIEKAYKTPFVQYTHPVKGVPQVCPAD